MQNRENINTAVSTLKHIAELVSSGELSEVTIITKTQCGKPHVIELRNLISGEAIK